MASGQKVFEINEILVTNKGKRMALTFGTCISSCTQLSVLYIPTFNTPRLGQRSKHGLDFNTCIFISMYSV